ncbi:hypothetical protein BC832DRAFT_592326 [Gaertneriomyces semiglobifer]|nr:hypothetical protein BC832DRAFT_592326 [Gaertneriomyces semiglobifer]
MELKLDKAVENFFSRFPLKEWTVRKWLQFLIAEGYKCNKKDAQTSFLNHLALLSDTPGVSKHARNKSTKLLEGGRTAFGLAENVTLLDALEARFLEMRHSFAARAIGHAAKALVIQNVTKRAYSELRDDGSDVESEDENPFLRSPKRVRATTPHSVEIVQRKGSYSIPSLSAAGETPNKPKVLNADLKKLSLVGHVAFATTANRVSLPECIRSEFVRYHEEQRAQRSLENFPLIHMKKRELELWRILRYGLLSYHEKSRPGAPTTCGGHERTDSIDWVIPWLSPLRSTLLVTWRWSEFGYTSQRNAIHAENDYKRNRIKFGDGVGLSPHDKDELILMESSGSDDVVDVEHGIGDALKLIETTTHALKQDLLKRKDASLSTIKTRAIIGIQFIKDRLTMAKTQITDDGKSWKIVECRNTVIPRGWNQLGHVNRVAELVATMYLEIPRIGMSDGFKRHAFTVASGGLLPSLDV